MPKVGMEPIRRSALVAAAIEEIGRAGSLDVTVSQIARKAGMSSALAHHYFGSKDQIFLSAMRAVLAVFGSEVREALRGQVDPRTRVRGVIAASFSPQNFRPEVISAWLNFYVLALNSPEALRLLRAYRRRLHSNLMHDLRPLVGKDAAEVARGIAAMIDGLYIRQSLRDETLNGAESVALVTGYFDQVAGSPAKDIRVDGGIDARRT